MPLVKYNKYPKIFVDDSQPDLYQKCLASLGKIESLPAGAKLLNAISATGHKLDITPKNGSTGSSCGEASKQAYVLFCQAKLQNNVTNLKSELSQAMKRSGMTVQSLGAAMAAGIAPATYVAARNVGRPGPSTGPAADWEKKILNLLAGQVQATDQILHKRLRRILRAWLTNGRGCNADIEINVERPTQCWSDGTSRLRYPTLCLAHEMVHAWRFMTGRALADYKEFPSGPQTADDIEEVITTGLPPYNFEEFSENMFRSQWPDTEVGMRTAY